MPRPDEQNYNHDTSRISEEDIRDNIVCPSCGIPTDGGGMCGSCRDMQANNHEINMDDYKP